MGTEPVDFCREIESYLCRKNDGHLIRVTGPSFTLVSGWAEQGIPLKIAYAGIDRYFERYYRSGPRRRPVKIDFCEADVLDVFDEWRRAVGVTQARADARDVPASTGAAGRPRGPSLPGHLERALLTLTAARARGTLGQQFDALLDRVSEELDAARAASGGLRGQARRDLLARLAVLDDELVREAAAALTAGERAALADEAAGELAPFRDRMAPDAFARAKAVAVARLTRERFGLPTLTFV